MKHKKTKKRKQKSIINFSEISRLVTGSRYVLREDYTGKEYRKLIEMIKKNEQRILLIIEQFKKVKK